MSAGAVSTGATSSGAVTSTGRDRVLLCLVVGAPRHYGVGQVWDDVLRGFAKRGWKVILAVLDAHHAADWQAAYPELTVVTSPLPASVPSVTAGRWRKLGSMLRRVGGQLSYLNWLTRLAKERGVHTLIIQSPPETLLAALVARRAKLRALWLVPNAVGNEVPFDLNRRIYRLVFRLGMVPVANSHFTDSTFGPGRHERHVVHLGVDTTYFAPNGDPRPVRDAFGIPMDAPVVGLFARLTPSKGQDRLIEALAQSGTPFHLLLCGGPVEGDYGDHLRRRIDELGLSGRVHLAGPQTDLRSFFAASDIIANVRVDPEPFGLTIIEAMASGKPVLVHGLGGPSEIVTDGREGWVLPNVELSTIAEGLRRALASRREWQMLGGAGARRAKLSFGKERFLRQIEELARRDR
ncbi:glycosyltransferase family 4 protein [Ancylobacter sp. IITR112]|uniref:glycosyltransferase family 4 protein n=1 Tax=Ancylobacter sp. IITR112 TaxID=3138073 RepID=UPI00352A76F6